MRILFISLITANCSFAQVKPSVRYGDLDSTRISINQFKKVSDVHIDSGYILEEAKLIFSGANFDKVWLVPYYPVLDSVKLSESLEKIKPGSIVLVEAKGFEGYSRKKFEISKSYIFSSWDIIIPYSPSEKYLEWKRLRGLSYLSGKIYFSGEGFRNVEIVEVATTDKSQILKLFDRVVPFSRIIFEGVKYLDEKGSIKTLDYKFQFE